LYEKINIREYIEKIIQAEIHIPEPEKKYIDTYFDENIEQIFSLLNISYDQKNDFESNYSYTYHRIISKYLLTLRKVKKYINGLYSNLLILKDEIFLSDLFVMEFIRMFFREIYFDIKEHPEDYICTSEAYRRGNDSLSSFIVRFKKRFESKISNPEDRENIKSLVYDIFPDITGIFSEKPNIESYTNIKTNISDKKISNPKILGLYYSLRISPDELSISELQSIIDQWNYAEIKDKENLILNNFKELKQNKKFKEFIIIVLDLLDQIDENTSQSLICAIYKYFNLFDNKEEEEFLKLTEYQDAAFLMLDLIDKNLKTDKIKQIIQNIVIKTPDNWLAIFTVFQVKKYDFHHISEAVDNNLLEKIQHQLSSRLKEHYTTENTNIFNDMNSYQWRFLLYQWATNLSDDSNKKYVNDYVFSLISENSKNFAKFINGQKHEVFSNKGNYWEVDFRSIEELYDLEKIVELARKFQEDDSLTVDEKNSIKFFLSAQNNENRTK